MISRLRGERDELRRTKERLHSERSTARKERDRAIGERDEERQVVSSLQVDLGVMVTQRLEAKIISTRLGMELAEVRGTLRAESDLGVAQPEENQLTCAPCCGYHGTGGPA